MSKQLVETFSKETSEHQIRLIAGIEPQPSEPYPNAIFYIRMESYDKVERVLSQVKPIWLSLNEMVKLGVLMNVASRFWLEQLDKESKRGRKKIDAFIDAWRQISRAVDDLLEE